MPIAALLLNDSFRGVKAAGHFPLRCASLTFVPGAANDDFPLNTLLAPNPSSL